MLLKKRFQNETEDIRTMNKSIKNRIMQFLWEHFHKNQPMIPEGLVDTTPLNDHLTAVLEQLKSLLSKDPHAFRQMQIGTRYRSTFSPDFTETINACLYECRLCNIYGLEYYLMYSLLLSCLVKEDIHDLRVLSMGCGSKIDGLSLSLALKDVGDSFDVQYTGVDISQWPMSFELPFDNRLIIKPMQEYFGDVKTSDVNVIVFPTVLSGLREYPDDTEALCRSMEEAQFLSDTIFLMAAYRSTISFNKDWQITDWQKVQRILTALEKKGYVTEELPASIPDAWKPYLKSKTAESEDGKKYVARYVSARYGTVQLREIAPDFAPPDCVEEYLKNPGHIRKVCPYYKLRRDQYLSRNPGIRPGEEVPETVCSQRCPIMCKLFPRVVFTQTTSPCFQIFMLRRQPVRNP